ncbi:hypothetical protein FTW19_11645 [Terriglobus albidus]|uniref:Uncharacterized protein n=1 Tax=Terriglobus albidus TaxID=1592106 RepID=A0A5B9E8R6_9BACT|nr:hypothetical protein [Terriglobus albidus]QEE28593.1 hypothetical protein FTW19_11645 [Terriglobus albidus]
MMKGVRMGTFRQFAIVLLLLTSYLAPAMACMVSDVQMDAEERACCRAMHHQCEQMGMPASHSCCQEAPQSTRNDALAVNAATYHPAFVATVWLTAAELFRPTLAAAGWVEHPSSSPLQSPPGSISVLRI